MKLRIFPSKHECDYCHHIMKYHDSYGCNVKDCVCPTKNFTVKQFSQETIARRMQTREMRHGF